MAARRAGASAGEWRTEREERKARRTTCVPGLSAKLGQTTSHYRRERSLRPESELPRLLELELELELEPELRNADGRESDEDRDE